MGQPISMSKITTLLPLISRDFIWWRHRITWLNLWLPLMQAACIMLIGVGALTVLGLNTWIVLCRSPRRPDQDRVKAPQDIPTDQISGNCERRLNVFSLFVAIFNLCLHQNECFHSWDPVPCCQFWREISRTVSGCSCGSMVKNGHKERFCCN